MSDFAAKPTAITLAEYLTRMVGRTRPLTQDPIKLGRTGHTPKLESPT